MAVSAGVLVGIGTTDFVVSVAGDTGGGAGDAAMIDDLMASLEVGGIGAMAIATVGCGADDVSCCGAVSPASQGAICGRGVAFQAVGGGAVAVGVFQDVAAMAGLTATAAGKECVQPLLMAGAEIGVVGSVAGNTAAAMAAVDALVWRL